MSRRLLDTLSGRRKGPGATLLRGVLSAAAPFYAAGMGLRNLLYDAHWLSVRGLSVPVISVGNITAGGTGKTPMVQWLVRRLAARGMHPAVLMRGYLGRAGMSDEQQMLAESLAGTVQAVIADPDRVAGGRRLLREFPSTDVVILDDGFQHRRLERQFDLVLVDATCPFGFERVHPRGLLREPLSGLRRADATVLTRSDLIPPEDRRKLEERLHGHSPRAALFRARHQLTGLRSGNDVWPPDWLKDRKWMAAAGIGNPEALSRQLSGLPGEFAGGTWFPDHHPYTADDVVRLVDAARAARAGLIVVTEKDWTKLAALVVGNPLAQGPVSFVRLQMELALDPGRDVGLVELLLTRLEKNWKTV